MKLDANNLDDLRPLVDSVVTATVERIGTNRAKLGDRLAYPEADAAALLEVQSPVLRDARHWGENAASGVGKRESQVRILADRSIQP